MVSSVHSNDTAAAIDVRCLRKSYGPRLVVDDLSFSVAPGEIFALLGPNGVGKTTTIEILEGYRRPDSGTVSVLGCDPWRDARSLRQRIGLMLQEGGVYPQARPREMLTLLAAFFPKPADPDQLLGLVGLQGVRTPYRRLSGGQKQRLSLALALVGQPELVFLDEPTAGMDPQARRVTWEIIRSLRARGATVLLTTHSMEEAEQLADRIGIMDQGRLVALGDLASLRHGDMIVRLVVAGEMSLDAVRALPGVRGVWQEQVGVYAIETETPPLLLAEVTAWAYRHDLAIQELRVGRESLEEIFLRLTGHAPRD